MPVEIVSLAPAEVLARAEEVRALYAAAFATAPYHEDAAGSERITQALLDHSRKPGFRCAAALDEGSARLVGLIYGYQGVHGDWWRERVTAALPEAASERWLGDCFEVAGFAVAPRAQRQGLGGRLHDTLLAGLPYRTAALSTVQTPTAALTLYRRKGWITLLENFHFAPGGEPWRVMALALPVPPREPAPAPLDPALRMRPFAPDDQVAARRLIVSGLGEHFGFVDESFNPDLADIAANYVVRGHPFIVVEREDQLVATGALRIESAETGSLVRMSVAPEERRRGIGRTLVAALVTEARHRGLRRLTIETNKDWYDAIGLYITCGFREFTQDDESVYLERTIESARSRAHTRDGRRAAPNE